MAKGSYTNGTPGLVPRPDPTLLTTEQLNREITSLRNVLETRLDSMDTASVLLHDDVIRRVEVGVTAVDTKLAALHDLHEEKLRGLGDRLGDFAQEVAVRFQERDTRSEREARDNKIAVDAAFAAAKEAVAENNKSSALATDKSEAGFTKQYDQLALLIETRAKASDDKIDDIKEQLSNRRSETSHVTGERAGVSEYRTLLLAIAGLVVSIIVAGVLIYAAFHK